MGGVGSVIRLVARLVAVATVLLGSPPALARELRTSAAVWVSEGQATRPHVEPTLAAHPLDRELLTGAAVTFEGEETVVVTFRSNDGGKSWLPGGPVPGCLIDPWVRFGPSGVVYLSCYGEWRRTDSRLPLG